MWFTCRGDAVALCGLVQLEGAQCELLDLPGVEI